jgi:hypothetical protein
MPVTVKVNGTSNTLVHKGSTGFAKCTAPDVCKTPSPGGPVPTPYPVIVSMSSDLENGTTTVSADGGNSCAIKGSDFSRCTGDEPGTAGGVKSNVNMKEATWILYSFDVKMDGGNACRKSDKMMMNHENTVCMSGEDQVEKQLEMLKDIACKCQETKPDESVPKEKRCERLIDDRGKCVTKKLKDKEKDGVWANARFKAPEGMTNPRTGLPVTRIVPDVVITAAGSFPSAMISVGKLARAAKAGMSGGPVLKVADFKFPCPPSLKEPFPSPSLDGKGYGAVTGAGDKELGAYRDIADPPNDVEVITPTEELCG